MTYNFDWSVLWRGQSALWLLQGLITTIEISAIAWVLAFTLGIFSGALRTVPITPLRWLASLYVEFFRNVPLLVWMFFWYFAVPPLLPQPVQDWLFDHGAEFWAGVVALGVYHGARFSEVMRSGIQSIPKTQFEAAVSTGLTMAQAYRLIIIPIALRLIIPPATNESLNLIKNSSVALTIGVAELTFQTRQIETYTAKAFEALTAGTLIYLLLCLAIATTMSQLEKEIRDPRDDRQKADGRILRVDFAVIINNVRFLIFQGFLGLGNFTGGTLRLAVPAIILGFFLGCFHRHGPSGPFALDSCRRNAVRRVFSRRAVSDGDLLVLVYHPGSSSENPYRNTAWLSRPSSFSKRPTSARSSGRESNRFRAARRKRPRRPDSPGHKRCVTLFCLKRCAT